MNLHEKKLRRGLARKFSPWISRILIRCKLTNFIRQLIAFLNYCIGRGAGMGWTLRNEVQVAVDCVQNENPVILDVGGNLGEWSEEFRRKVTGGKIYIFEPQPACQKVIEDKKIPNSELIRAAVGKEKSHLTLYSSSELDVSASLHERKDSFFTENVYESTVVQVISLSDFASERGLEFIDYAKFDIEGHELFALEGFRPFLMSRKIGAFSFEFGSGNLNSKTVFRDFWDLLHPDYSIYIITPSGILDEVKDYYEDLEFYRGVSNYVARLKPHIEQ